MAEVKTMRVRLKEGGTEMVINETDFNGELHEPARMRIGGATPAGRRKAAGDAGEAGPTGNAGET